jgi:hypothetical protein
MAQNGHMFGSCVVMPGNIHRERQGALESMPGAVRRAPFRDIL